MSLSWSDSEKTLLEAIRPVLSTREISKVFELLNRKRSTDAIQKQSRKLSLTFKDFGVPATHGLMVEEKTAINTVLKDREGFLVSFEPEIVDPAVSTSYTKKKKEIVQLLMESLKEIRETVPHIGSVSLNRASGSGESIVLVLSDWHWGHIVTDNEENIEIYNPTIATSRILATAPMLIGALGEKCQNVDEIVVVLMGDHVSGEMIFPHQEMMLHEHAASQVLSTTKATWTMIQMLRQAFPLVRIVTTKGNHGRTNGSPESNWDNMIYQQLELLVDMSEDPGLSIKNRYGDYATVNIKGWKGLIRHHAPVQADTAGGIAKFASWYGMHDWDFFCFGHYHHWGVFTWNGKPIIRNGSLVGCDDFAETLAKSDDPVQMAFGITEESTCTSIYPLKYV